MTSSRDPFGARAVLDTDGGRVGLYRLEALDRAGVARLERIPSTVKILLENLLRLAGATVDAQQVVTLASWGREAVGRREFPYSPSRVILQDFTGVPAVVDLAAMRAAVSDMGGDPARVDPLVPVDLVIDHSVQVDEFGTVQAFATNVDREYERNHERYSLLRWAQQAYRGFRVVPPGLGIVHQVNLEHLGSVVALVEEGGDRIAVPDTLVGTDSHTTMINGLGILGWGVGGIEAEAALLGQPLPLGTPKVVGFRMTGALGSGATATDLVLTITEMLRAHGVVGSFVEYFGDGVGELGVADRATISNMCPEYGATAALWPIDRKTLDYLRLTNRADDHIDLVERYAKEQGLWRYDGAPPAHYTEVLDLDLTSVQPSVAGPRRPQDRVALSDVWDSFRRVYGRDRPPQDQSELRDGSVVIAAITSCTNTSNPSVMMAAGLVAKNAVERGLSSKPWVKTSLAPGSRVVTKYLEAAGLVPYLEKLGFHTVGYGCTTCIGNSGPLPDHVAAEIEERDLSVVSVLSGNRNFEGRIHPQVKASYLASPPLVVAYALAGTAHIDLTSEPLGSDESGTPVHLRDIWPQPGAIEDAMKSISSDLFAEEYAHIFDGDTRWVSLPSPEGPTFRWDETSTYVRKPPFFERLDPRPLEPRDIEGARVLALLGDSVTTDHISPAGAIPPTSPAGRYLIEQGVTPHDFNSYGARRGNHEVMVRGTFASIRLRNALADREGGWTRHFPGGEPMSIYDAATVYAHEEVPLIVIAGREYGSGSSRDWAAKGPLLLGVRAVIAESYERIHRSNLVGMGVLPLQFLPEDSVVTLGLDGTETYSVRGVSERLSPGVELAVTARRANGSEIGFSTLCRIDSPVEMDYLRHGGVLPMVVRRILEEG
jgi:aconitate hydratase